ncbi:MAG: response regulator [Polyangiaceae bacterium]|jgi:DNA-binding response OmpR family regulator|nr:response regulator [Polyangiaceae bacterium]
MRKSANEVLNVLVIDDDEGTRQLLVDIVTREEHQAVAAASAEEGLNLLPFWTFQVAFIDQRLPGMEGLVLGEYLRRNNPDMVVALVTGAGDDRIVRRSKDLAITYLQKPFRVDDILGVIDAWLAAARERERVLLERRDPDFCPPIARYAADLAECYAMPRLPERIEERLVATVRQRLNDMRSVRRYTERDRIVALSGLMTASVLGVGLPKTSAGVTLYEEYDAIMKERGKRTEFDDSGDEPLSR